MSLWTAEDAARATGGQTAGWTATGVSIDTRELRPGDLFVALSDRRDGHDFVAAALERGAAAAMVDHVPDGVAPDAPLLMVPDVLEGLRALGAAGRARATGRVVAVTGSAGKTSAKEMLRHVLGPGTHAAERSFNNHWGVPLTLARMPPEAPFGVVEIGMNAPGEIAPLARLARPDVALITSIGPAHLAAFGSLDGIAREKASIAEGLEPGGVLVVPSDTPQAPLLRDAYGGEILCFGRGKDAELRLTDDMVVHAGRAIPLRLAVPGEHHRSNAAGVLAVVSALGLDVPRAAEALAEWLPPEGRGLRETLHLPGGPITLIDEAYNANPASMAAALSVLLNLDGRRVAVLGDMLELGADAPTMHAALADDRGLKAADAVHSVGPLMRHLHDALPEPRRGLWTEDADEMAARLPGLLRPGDAVIVKGSKGIRVSAVVDALRALGHRGKAAGASRGEG